MGQVLHGCATTTSHRDCTSRVRFPTGCKGPLTTQSGLSEPAVPEPGSDSLRRLVPIAYRPTHF